MALSDEQNAMLRLLAQGEQGYGDIAALMGLSEAEVRAKVVGALAQLEAEGVSAPDVPPPIPAGAAPAAEVEPPEPEPVEEVAEDDEPAIAEALAPQEPVAPAPAPRRSPKPKAAKKAKAASTKARPTAPAPGPAGRPSSSGSSGGRTITLPTGRRAWLLGGGLLGAIAVIVIVVLLVSSGGGGDSSTTASEGAVTNPSAETAGAEENGAPGATAEGKGGQKELTQAELTAVDGSDAKGLATFGRVKNKLALQIEATGLEPTEEGTNSYTIWLAQSPKRMLPLASTGVKASGKEAGTIAAQFEVPVEVLAYLANGTFDQLSITKTDNERFEATIAEATKAKSTPTYTGEAVLHGTIVGPIIGLAKREEEAKGK